MIVDKRISKFSLSNFGSFQISPKNTLFKNTVGAQRKRFIEYGKGVLFYKWSIPIIKHNKKKSHDYVMWPFSTY